MKRELKDAFEKFTAKVLLRLEEGARVYGDASLDLPTPRLTEEIQQELEDVAGWSILLWMRLERIRSTTEAIRKRIDQEGVF